MKRSVLIEPFDENRNFTIYMIRFYNEDGTIEELSEIDKFLDKYKDSNSDEIDKFIALLDVIQNEGLGKINLRDERNKECENLFALIDEDAEGIKYQGNLRLYCLKFNDKRLILGGGSLKMSGTYQQDPNISIIAEELIKINIEIKKKLNNHEFWWAGNKLISRNELKIEIET